MVSALTNWPCMMVVQWHLQWLENIVVPHHLTSSQRAMRYWSILLEILRASQMLDSSWCTIQQVINTVQIGLKFLATQSFLGLPLTIYVHRVLALCDFWKWEKNRISQKLHYAKIRVSGTVLMTQISHLCVHKLYLIKMKIKTFNWKLLTAQHCVKTKANLKNVY